MSRNKTNKQKYSASRPAGTKFVRLMRRFAKVQMMHVDINNALRIKEDSP
jgi:hypothetical protein